VLEKAGIDGQIIVICFEHDWLRQLPMHLAKGLLMHRAMPLPNIAGTQVIDCHWSAVFWNPLFIRRVHQRQLKLWVWTVDHRWLQWLLRCLGVDGITTNTLITKK
jgi:glycerophosphoryl diester phosphodiesterase